jgi:DHA3 family tetracycline resistance protein-like MFS transporter
VKIKNPLLVYLALEGGASLLFAMIFNVNMIYQVTVAKLNPLQLVLVGTMLETTVFLFEVPTGIVADLHSRRISVIIGYFLIGAGFILEGSLPLFGTILLAQFLWGLGYTFTSGATQAWISDEIGEEVVGQAFLRGNQVGQAGSLLGIFLSVILGQVAVTVPIITGGALLMLIGVILLVVMPETGFKPTPPEERNTWQNMVFTFRNGIQMVKRRRILVSILGIGLFYGLYSEGYDRLWTKHLIDTIHLPAWGGLGTVAWFGIINAVGIFLSIFATEIVRRRTDTRNQRAIATTMMAVTVGLVVSLIAYAQARIFILAVLLIWTIHIIRNVIGPLYTTWVNQRLDSNVRATVISMSSQVDAIGQIGGGPMIGMIGNLFSVPAAITFSGLLLSPILALYARAIRRTNGPLPVETSLGE